MRRGKREIRETYRVEADAMFWLAAKCVISYPIGMPRRLKALGSLTELARPAKSPNKYSVFSSRPSKVRVISTRPWTFSANREELMDLACDKG